jgi:hypothetical protein
MVRAKVKPDTSAQLESAAQKMFAAIHAAHPEGVQYASSRLADGMTYVALLKLDDGIENPLPRLPAFVEFQENVKAWMTEPPTVEQLTVVGSYNLFA